MSRTEKEGKENSLASAFDSILKEFGTSVPQLSIVIAVIIGSLGFDEYFNAGAWTIVAILCFSLVYLFRRQITHDLRKTGIFVFVLVLLFLTPVVVVGLTLNDFALLLRKNIVIITVYLAISITIPLAILISSYRKQEQLYGLPPYPTPLNDAIDNQLIKVQFYRSNILYDIVFIDIDDKFVTLETRMSYDVTNRGSSNQEFSVVLRTDDPNAKVIDFSFNGEKLFVDDPSYRRPHGFEVRRSIPGGETVSVYFHDKSKYRLSDSELYTTYDPATDLTLQVRIPEKIEIVPSFEVHYKRSIKNVDPKREGNYIVVHMLDGLLPYQGVRMNWDKKGGRYG